MCINRKSSITLPGDPLEAWMGRLRICYTHSAKEGGIYETSCTSKAPSLRGKSSSRWAQEHRDWTKEQWESFLWSDETWISGTRHRKIWVTRRGTRRVRSYMRYSSSPQQRWLDVLGLLFRGYQRALSTLGEGLGYNLHRNRTYTDYPYRS